MIFRDKDRMSAIFWLAISLFVCVESIRGDVGTFRHPGPGFLPFWAGVILGTLSVILVVKSILKKGGETITDLWKWKGWNKVIKVILVPMSLFIYAIFLPILGYLITTFGLMAFLLSMIGRPKLWIQVTAALIIALISYIIFHAWLNVQLPKGVFGF